MFCLKNSDFFFLKNHWYHTNNIFDLHTDQSNSNNFCSYYGDRKLYKIKALCPGFILHLNVIKCHFMRICNSEASFLTLILTECIKEGTEGDKSSAHVQAQRVVVVIYEQST